MSDYISRADAMVAVCKWCEHPYCESKEKCGQWIAMTILPSAELPKGDMISRADAIEAVQDVDTRETVSVSEAVKALKALPSADAVDVNEVTIHYKPYPSADAVDVAHDIPEYCSWSQTYTNMVQSAMADTKSADAEQVTSKLEHDRDWIIGCIKHDGFIKTDRFDKANKIILDALSADAEQTDELENQPCLVERNYTTEGGGGEIYHPTRQQGKWLPIEETLPTYDGGEKTWLTGMKCSNCGKLFDLRVGYYFCPSCGARMKGGAE